MLIIFKKNTQGPKNEKVTSTTKKIVSIMKISELSMTVE